MATQLMKSVATTTVVSVLALGLVAQYPNHARAQSANEPRAGSGILIFADLVIAAVNYTLIGADIPNANREDDEDRAFALRTIRGCLDKVRLDRETSCEVLVTNYQDCEISRQSLRLSPHFFDNFKDPSIGDDDDEASRMQYTGTFNTTCRPQFGDCGNSAAAESGRCAPAAAKWFVGDKVKIEVILSSDGTRSFLGYQKDIQEDDPDKAHPCNRSFKPGKRVNITRYQQSDQCINVRRVSNEKKQAVADRNEASDRFDVAKQLADMHMETAQSVFAESINLIRDMNKDLKTFYRNSGPSSLRNQKIQYRQPVRYFPPTASRKKDRRRKLIEILNGYSSRIYALNRDADSMVGRFANFENYIKTFTLLNPGTRLGGAMRDIDLEENLRNLKDRARILQDKAVLERNYVRNNQDINNLEVFRSTIPDFERILLLPQIAYFPRIR